MTEVLLDEERIDECFPMPSYRPNQKEIIQSIVRHINNGKKYVIAECPTGAGKSPIAVTLARLARERGSAYYITTTKLLQDQIEADFPSVVTLKGRNAYPCTVYENFEDRLKHHMDPQQLSDLIINKPGCDEGYCKSRGKSSCQMCIPPIEEREETTYPEGHNFSFCPYFEQFFSALNAATASMNFNNFILHLNYGGKFTKRRILVIDEAHNCEDKLLSFLECKVSSIDIRTEIPKFDSPLAYVKWLLDINVFDILKERLEDATGRNDIKEMNRIEGLAKNYIEMMKQVKLDPNGWVFEWEHDQRIDMTKVTLKPIFVHHAAKELLFRHADIVVFLSATILNARTFASNLGIPDGEWAAERIPSTFPIENRPIVKNYVTKFTGGKARMEEWIGPMAERVTEIADRYQNYRGIIHTHSFNIQKRLMEVLPRRVTSRLLQQHDFNNNKTQMLQAHAEKQGSILIAPAMHEGVDLKDDLSRFQILCKVPFANFYDDKQLEARMELDRVYYDYITILKIVQSVGRSVRSARDWADTFIIDESFDRVYLKNQSSFPQWFKEAVTYKIPQPRVACDMGQDCGCDPLSGCQQVNA